MREEDLPPPKARLTTAFGLDNVYVIHRTDDGRYVLWNKDYSPIGHKRGEREGAPHEYIDLPDLTPEIAKKLSVDQSSDTSHIYLYNNDCHPMDSEENMQAYNARLGLLRSIVPPEVNIVSTRGAMAELELDASKYSASPYQDALTIEQSAKRINRALKRRGLLLLDPDLLVKHDPDIWDDRYKAASDIRNVINVNTGTHKLGDTPIFVRRFVIGDGRRATHVLDALDDRVVNAQSIAHHLSDGRKIVERPSGKFFRPVRRRGKR